MGGIHSAQLATCSTAPAASSRFGDSFRIVADQWRRAFKDVFGNVDSWRPDTDGGFDRMTLHGFTHLALRVSDLREAEAFYCELFALEVAWR
jgi:hypothetical protein